MVRQHARRPPHELGLILRCTNSLSPPRNKCRFSSSLLICQGSSYRTMDNAPHRALLAKRVYDRDADDASTTALLYRNPSRLSVATSATANTPAAAAQRTASRGPVTHTYSLFDARNTPWATLKVLSNAASPRYLPSYFEGQAIAGAVDLSFAKPDAIQAVTITLSGKIVATNANPLTFWELTHVLWSAEMGDPRAPQSPSAPAGRGKGSAKLVGPYSWPFSIALPTSCNFPLRSKLPPVSLCLPPSFSEKGAAQFINYDITVRIRRGALRVDSKYV